MEIESFLKDVADASRKEFESQRRVMSFGQWLETFCSAPIRMGRSAAQYLLDCFEYYGWEETEVFGRKVRRFKLFDAPFDPRDKLVGNEEAQQDVYELVKRFAALGKADRLVLLHGPNGSGKSTFMELILRALEDYSATDQGAVFSFNWIFTERMEGGRGMGFGSSKEEMPKDTLAFIDENLISCKLPSDLRENPIYLIPQPERSQLLDRLYEELPAQTPNRSRLRGAWLRDGQLGGRSKTVYDALLTAYQGDWLKVVRHIQVERYFISKRYRVGAAVIEPQQAVDANSRPMSFERGLTLPPVLQGHQIHDLSGELVDASGGVVEYSDMLKRPLELNKYLLNTCERGTISLPHTLAYVNLVMLGTANEKYLSAFKANPDFTSFKGRMELVRFGYLLDWRKEREVYRDYLADIAGHRHTAPHTLDVAAIWAVMSRLRKPDPERHEADVAGIVRELNPLEKARLYSEKAVPERLNTEQKRELLAALRDLAEEHREDSADFENFVCSAYEGRRGASAREMMALLADAADDPEYACLSPQAVFHAIKRLLRDRSVYDFLRLEADEGYHDCENFIKLAREEYFRWAAVEIYDSMELVEKAEFPRRVEDYFRNVRAYVAAEKLHNERTGAYEDPNEETMRGLEKHVALKESPDTFRRNLMTKVAAYSLEHPKEKINYAEIFPDLIAKLRDSYYEEQKKPLQLLARHILLHETEDANLVPAAERPKVERTLKHMRERYGYCDACAKEAISFVLREMNDKD